MHSALGRKHEMGQTNLARQHPIPVESRQNDELPVNAFGTAL